MATHSSILAWRIPWKEEPGGLQSLASQSDTIETTWRARMLCQFQVYSKVIWLYVCIYIYTLFFYRLLQNLGIVPYVILQVFVYLFYRQQCVYVWRRRWHPIPVLLPEKSHGWRSLVGCSPWGREESDTTERLHFHFSPSCTGEGNGNPLQCSCPENPRDRGAWWAAVYGVAQSRTRLKRLSSSSSSVYMLISSSNFIPSLTFLLG